MSPGTAVNRCAPCNLGTHDTCTALRGGYCECRCRMTPNPESARLAATSYEDDRTTFDAIHAPEGYVYPELEALVAEAIKRYPNQDAPSWLSPIAAILVVERWLIERAQIDGSGGVS